MKKINGCSIHLQKGDGTFLGRYHTGSNKIFYNLRMIKEWSKVYKMSFDELLILTISHEYIHKLLNLTEGVDACTSWDNISSNLQEYGCV